MTGEETIKLQQSSALLQGRAIPAWPYHNTAASQTCLKCKRLKLLPVVPIHELYDREEVLVVADT
jgi:hypothetical protein